MEEPIRNRVAESGLIQLELSELISIDCVELDYTNWLHEGQVLIEKQFRLSVAELDNSDLSWKWDGRDLKGDLVNFGVYILRFIAASGEVSHKETVVVIK